MFWLRNTAREAIQGISTKFTSFWLVISEYLLIEFQINVFKKSRNQIITNNPSILG